MVRWPDGGASHDTGLIYFFVKVHARIGDRITPAWNIEYARVFF